MSREIKFRAWDNETNKYFEPTYQSYMGRLEELTIALSGRLQKRTCRGVADESTFHGRYVVEQYTGIKDANGKEIYEGDVLEYYYETHGQTFYDPDTLGAVGGEPGIETNVIGKVAIWPSTGVMLTRIKAEYPEDFDSSNLDVPKILHVNKHFTIIGNVHTNPELLEADKWPRNHTQNANN